MSLFEEHLRKIGSEITIDDTDRQPYTKDFDGILHYILSIMQDEDYAFKQICKGPSLFGSYSNNVRIKCPDEFDVIIKLSFPYSRYMVVDPDPDRPGYLNIDLTGTLEMLDEHNGYDDVIDRLESLVDLENNYLRGYSLKRWLSKLIREGLNRNGYYITGACTGYRYRLQYSKRGLAHTIYAHNLTVKDANISIDLVPGIMFFRQDWMDKITDRRFRWCEKWFALPKPCSGPPNATRKFAFMICNPKLEHDLMLGKYNLKVVYRLLKALRDEYEMDRLKSYFLTTAFLSEILKQRDSFWHQPIGVILVHMLGVLFDYFADGFMPFFWDDELNLLDILSQEEIDYYGEQLCRAHNILLTYEHQPHISYGRVASHFALD